MIQVVQVYISWPDAIPAPVRQLAAFERVTLKPSQTVQLQLYIKPELMRVWIKDDEGYVIPPGLYLYVYT